MNHINIKAICSSCGEKHFKENNIKVPMIIPLTKPMVLGKPVMKKRKVIRIYSKKGRINGNI